MNILIIVNEFNLIVQQYTYNINFILLNESFHQSIMDEVEL